MGQRTHFGIKSQRRRDVLEGSQVSQLHFSCCDKCQDQQQLKGACFFLANNFKRMEVHEGVSKDMVRNSRHGFRKLRDIFNQKAESRES